MVTMAFNHQRRRLLMLAIAAGLSACATTTPRQPINIDVREMKNLKELIAAIRKETGDLLSTTMDDSFYRSFAQAFVDNALVAAEKYRIPIPEWVLERLRFRKTVVPVIAAPAASAIIFQVGGATVQVLLWDFFALALASITTLGIFISAILPGNRKSST